MIGRSLVSLASLAWAQGLQAQSTNIVADVAPGLTLETTVDQNGNTFTIDGGTTVGSNLFHSFSDFDLGAADIAQWVYSSGVPASIDNVISRVTGGSPSSIMGTIDSTAIPNADFYFINPAGIVFSGPDAHVNVPAAAHFSTASELRFANGQVFSVATPSGSTLSIAAPTSFGFLGNEGDILLTTIENLDDTPFIANAGPLSLSAANVTFDNALVGAYEQTVTAVGAVPLTVGIDGSTSGPAEGRIEMAGSWLQTWAADCYEACIGAEGFISLNAGELDIQFSGVVTDFDSQTDEGGVSFVRLIGNDGISITDSAILADGYDAASAGDVTIVSQGDIAIIDSIVLAYTQGSGAGGLVEISGANVLVSGGVIGSESVGAGDGGAVVITAADKLQLENDAWILTTGYDSGAAGSVVLTAADISIADSLVASESYGSGDAGTVSVNAADGLTAFNSLISSSTYAEGNGGIVAVTVGGFLLMDGSTVSSNSSITSDAGDVKITAAEATLTNGSVISSDGFVDGDAGNVEVAVSGHLQVTGSSRISSSGGQDPVASPDQLSAEIAAASDVPPPPPPPPPPPGTPEPYIPPPPPPPTFGTGAAGSVTISAGKVSITDSSQVSSASYGLGDGGNILVSADSILLDLSTISSDSFGGGDAGTIFISAGQSLALLNSTISSSTYSSGDGGSIDIDVGGVFEMLGGLISADSGTVYYPESDLGDAGSVSITADVVDMDRSSISTTTTGNGAGGEIDLTARDIVLSGFSSISTDSYGSADAGRISVVGETLTMTGVELVGGSAITSIVFYGGGASGNIEIDIAGHFLMEHSGINTDNQGFGRSGAIQIQAGSFEMRSAHMASNTNGPEDSGSIEIDVEGAVKLDNAVIMTNAGGDIHTADTGDAGQIAISGDSISLNSSTIASVATNDGQGGQISLDAGEFTASSMSQVATNAYGLGSAGNILINADLFTLTGDSGVSSENLGQTAGDAGSILIRSGAVTVSGARVSTNSLTGAAGDITFDMTPGSLLILSGETAPGVIETSSGPGTGGVITIASPLAIISNGGTISALGESGGANVQIDANYFIASSDRPNVVQVDGNLTFSNAIYDVSSGTIKADLSMVDASGVLQGQCSTVRSTGQLSQLNIRPTGPYGDAELPSIRGIGSKVPATGGANSGACQ